MFQLQVRLTFGNKQCTRYIFTSKNDPKNHKSQKTVDYQDAVRNLIVIKSFLSKTLDLRP